MKRVNMQPRPDWQKKCEEVGFSFYDLPSENNEPYWRESAAYELSTEDVENLEAYTKELFERCMDAVDFVIANNRFAEFGIPSKFWPLIKQSWDDDHATVFGRFDLAWQSDGKVKMLEFNADTPTSLVESSVVQWFWLKDVFGDSKDQFNSIHEQLVQQWEHIRKERWNLPQGAAIHMASLHDCGDGQLLCEDFDNVAYMAEVAAAAGFCPQQLFVEDIRWDEQRKMFTNKDGRSMFVNIIRWDEQRKMFTNKDGRSMYRIYKLYPWEWMVNEAFADNIITSFGKTKWVEPIWKMLLSNKQLLVILWELFPGHDLLLPAYNTSAPLLGQKRVRKPKLGREGANVHIFEPDGKISEAVAGQYGTEGYVWQQYAQLPNFDGWNAVIGSWVVGDCPAGVDFRETSSLVTGDLAFIVPHYIK